MDSSLTSGALVFLDLSPHGGSFSRVFPSGWGFLQHGGLRMVTLFTQKPEFKGQEQKQPGQLCVTLEIDRRVPLLVHSISQSALQEPFTHPSHSRVHP